MIATCDGGWHNFSTADQGLLGLAVAVRQEDKTKEPLPLRTRYCIGEGYALHVTTCPVCDEFFEALARDACWEGVANTRPDLYVRWCVWTYNETRKLKK